MQTLSDQYLSSSGPERLKITHKMDFQESQALKQVSKAGHRNQPLHSESCVPFPKHVTSLSPSGQPYEEAVTQGYCQTEQGTTYYSIKKQLLFNLPLSH